MRGILVAFCAGLLRVFFRRIEVVGRHHVPASGAVVFAANHANGLLDPLMLLCLSGRRVSFLAKEPLFRMPLIGYFVRSFECLPVYRSQDGQDPEKNRNMLRRAVELLGRGNALGLFPEGTSHSDPSLRPFRSGAARLSLSARALGEQPVQLVPLFLYYEHKQTFRSRAVVAFGSPIAVPIVAVDEAGSPSRDDAHALTALLRQAIEAIAPTAETVDALLLAERAERILEAHEPSAGPAGPSLADRMTLRRRLLDSYPLLVQTDPERTEQLLSRISALSLDFERRGLAIDAQGSKRRLRGPWLRHGLALAVLGLPGALGFVLHAPAYQLIKWLAVRYSGTETDVVATTKLVAGLLLIPLTWLLASLCLAAAYGLFGGALGLALLPLSAAAALGLLDTISWMSRQWGAHQAGSGEDFPALVERRRLLAADLRELLERNGIPT